MKRRINIKNTSQNFGKPQALITSSMNQKEDKNLKPVEEWIYGTLNIIGSKSTINFKNQKAFNGYQKKKIDLCKSLNLFNILFLIL